MKIKKLEDSDPVNLHYAKIDLGLEDIPVTRFKNLAQLTMWIMSKFGMYIGNPPRVVYLISFEDKWRGFDHVFVTEHGGCLNSFILAYSELAIITDIFIQEYDSYEEAYAVALDMKECVSELAYPNSDNSNSKKHLN